MITKLVKRVLIVALFGVCTMHVAAQGKKVDVGSIPLIDKFNPEAAKQLISNGVCELVFVKRHTLTGNHYYTEYLNSKWMPGGNLYVLNLENGKERALAPSLEGGVFNRFDVSFDATKIVFDYKESSNAGYRIYEVNVDGTGLRQITFPADNEDELIARYGNKHKTDDLHPCYLPDGGIAFVSTRCQYGILCNTPDVFTTKVLYRMNADGTGMRQLSNSVVSEAAPTMMSDGRILYHRWEYLDKSQAPVKCLWAVKPDGSGAVEVFGNLLGDVSTLIYGREIPGAPHKLVALAASHCCPNNAMGSIVLIDTNKDIRSTKPLSYITKDVDAREHNGFSFLVDGEWMHSERTGRPGRLFKDPYPVSESLFIAAMKNKGYEWNHPHAYDLYMVNADGKSIPLYLQKNISCWHPYPLIKRTTPPVAFSPVNENLAKANKATCIVTDVYAGLDGVRRGDVKYIRIMEQVPRPWSAHNQWYGDGDSGSHTVLGMNNLGLKVQHGVVPVEDDGSAYFEVPANKNIYLQVLDENFMMIQTERTYNNYMPGETRSCIGCHDKQSMAPSNRGSSRIKALHRAPAKAMAQPGEQEAKKVFDYMSQVQPVLDKHCLSCHNSGLKEGGLDLSSTPTSLYTVSYEALMGPKGKKGITPVGERFSASEYDKHKDIAYKDAYYSGSHTSPLVIAISGGKIRPSAIDDLDMVNKMVEAHKDVDVSDKEYMQVVNWIDAFGQFYPSYWGLKNKAFEGHLFFRPRVSFDEAISSEIPMRLQPLYDNPPPSDHLNPKKNKKPVAKTKKKVSCVEK